jgi:hypothetical protein
MLSKLLKRIRDAFTPQSDQDRLDEFITKQQPTSVCDVEHWINVYDRNQHNQRSSVFNHYRN